jgi:hypothetical protein
VSRPFKTLSIGLVFALLVHVLLVDRFLLVLADDVEALLHNLHLDWTTDYAQAWYANTDWIAPFRRALRFGLAPASVLGVLTLGFRMREVMGGGVDPLTQLPTRVRWTVGGLALIGLAAAAFPLSLGLSMWTAVEAYAWVEWYGHAEPLMQDLYNVLPFFVLPGVVLVGALVIAAALVGRRSALRNPVAYKRLRRAPALLAGTAISAPLLVVLFIGLFHAPRTASLPGRSVWAPTCGGCHERTLPLYYVKTPDEWQETVRTHRTVEQVDLDEQEAADLHGFLSGMRAFDDAWTFRTRCQNCHGSGWRGWESRTVDDWADIVRRLSRWSPYYYSPGIEEQLVRFLVTEKGTLDAGFEDVERYEDYVDVVETCDPCHSVGYEAERYRTGTRDDAVAMIERMNQKLIEPLDDAELQVITDDYLELLSEPKLFDRLFPHDVPESGGGGL